ncbi:NADH-cytochrome b5 reductase 1 [Choanephora cucurbitarum]|uniref:NADH-cytochrome b5 reductase 1 n=1 Tax=Choanephora cucurbitarum TaxID=101091 RepID=A0A1C7NGQ4_9FUNG|nr:NADH-cytochrome b5 reductase 1 [Choanephora cucurbitarum]
MITTQEAVLLLFALVITVVIWYTSIPKRSILDPATFKRFKLIEKTPVSHNTCKYRFQLPYPDDALGLPIGQHIAIMAEINGKKISRSYTPITPEQDRGHFDLVIKSYPTGNISKLMGELKVGDSVGIRGPKGNFAYRRNMVRAIGMIAGGTGITPMLQIIRRICYDPSDTTKIDLIFANITLGDILLKDELDTMATDCPDQFQVHYVLERPPSDWSGETGFVTKEMVQKYCPAPAHDIKLLLCGPLLMMKAMTSITTELGYQKPRAVSKMEDQVYKF